MKRKYLYGTFSVVITLVLCGLLVWVTAALASSGNVTGQARAYGGNINGKDTYLADTGTLSSVDDARDASMTTGSVPSVFSAEVLSSATISWSDEVDSEASLANFHLTLGGNTITADLLMARGSATYSGKPTGSSFISGLSINGSPVVVTGAPNQKVSISGGWVIINEQNASANEITVNPLHVQIPGVANLTVASATAGIN